MQKEEKNDAIHYRGCDLYFCQFHGLGGNPERRV
jgi:hypothetical protein